MNKLVSIILPVYNVEKYIEKCIQSILDQSYIYFELLVINDGSVDNSIRIIEKFKDKRITIYHKKNGGVSEARNFGLNKIKGDYIYFIDADDWIEPNLLATCIKSIEIHKSNFVVFSYFLDKENFKGNLIHSKLVNIKSTVFHKEKNNIKIDNNTLYLMGFVWNKFYRASFINDYKLRFNKDISLFEDVIFNTKIFELVDKIVLIDKVLYHYIDRDVKSLSKMYKPNLFDLLVLKDKYIFDFLTTWKINLNDKNRILSNLSFKGIRYYIHSLFFYKNDLNLVSKLDSIKNILNQEKTQKYISIYIPRTLKDKVYKFLIINKLVYCIYVINKIIK